MKTALNDLGPLCHLSHLKHTYLVSEASVRHLSGGLIPIAMKSKDVEIRTQLHEPLSFLSGSLQNFEQTGPLLTKTAVR